MRPLVYLFALVGLLAVLMGSTYTITNTFTSGTTAVASEVNANFSAAKTAIDDNDARIDALLTTDTCTTPPCDLTSGTTIGGSTVLLSGGALGTPSSGTLTNATGLPISTGVSGLGLGVASALAQAASASSGFVLGSDLTAKSAATSTDNAIARFDSTSGDIQNSGVTIDDSNNVTVPGDIDAGTSGAFCMVIRDSDDGGNSACEVLDGTFSCETDTNGICGDAT